MTLTQPSMEQLPEGGLIRAIQSLRRENKVQDALVLLKQQAFDRWDLSEETRVQLLHLEAECHQDSSDYADAVETCDRILACREDPVAHVNGGLAYWAMGDTQRAVESYEKATRVGPVDLFVLRSLGELHNQREEHSLALNCLQTAIASVPEDAAMWCASGVAYHNPEQWLRACNALTRAVELDPKNRVARPGKTKIEEEFELSGGS